MDPNLNLNQLRVFHAAAEGKSFTLAADKLHLTQPGISKHIKALEEYYAVRLFDRIGRSISLTSAGEILFEATQQVFQVLEETKKKMDDLECNSMGALRIGASITLGIYVLLPYVKRFRTQYPNIEVSLDVALSREVEEKTVRNLLDVGFVGAPVRNDRLISEILFKDELVLALPADHPWCNRKMIRVTEIKDVSMLVSQSGSGTRSILEARFRELGILPRFVELGHTESIKRAVEAGLGISILSKYVVERELKQGLIKTARLTGIDLKRDFYCIFRKDKYLSRAALTFISLIHSNPFPKLPPPGDGRLKERILAS